MSTKAWLVPAAIAWLAATPARAETLLVERVAARVDGRPIFLSELRERAKPYLAQVARDPNVVRVVATREIRRRLLERRIDEALIERLAEARHLAVADEQVDGALVRIARANATDVRSLLAEVRLHGYSEQEYRAEIRRQILEAWVLDAEERTAPTLASPVRTTETPEQRRARVLDRVRRRACIERLLRF